MTPRWLPLWDVLTGSFLGWWSGDLVWRAPDGRVAGYLEPVYGPWCAPVLPNWAGLPQEYVLYAVAPGDAVLVVGEVLSGVMGYGPQWVGRFVGCAPGRPRPDGRPQGAVPGAAVAGVPPEPRRGALPRCARGLTGADLAAAAAVLTS